MSFIFHMVFAVYLRFKENNNTKLHMAKGHFSEVLVLVFAMIFEVPIPNTSGKSN